MKVLEIVNKLDLDIVAGSKGVDKKVNGVFICDLLSLVMSNATSNNIWITIQTHLNIIAVATLVDLSCIIIVEDMDIDNDTIDKANELNIPLIKTKLSAYELACKLNELGV